MNSGVLVGRVSFREIRYNDSLEGGFNPLAVAALKYRRKEEDYCPGQPIDSRATSAKHHMQTTPFVRALKTSRPSVVMTLRGNVRIIIGIPRLARSFVASWNIGSGTVVALYKEEKSRYSAGGILPVDSARYGQIVTHTRSRSNCKAILSNSSCNGKERL
jgi:hypothetical protein